MRTRFAAGGASVMQQEDVGCVARSLDSVGDSNIRTLFSSGHLPRKVRPLHTPYFFYAAALLNRKLNSFD